MKRTLSAALLLVAMGCGGSKSSASHSTPTVAVARRVIASGLSAPMQYVASPSDPSLAYVLERDGRVRVLVNDALASASVLDITGVVITDGECGLQGMTFDPDYATNGYFYLQYNTGTPGTGPWYTRVTRFTMAAGGRTVTGAPQPIFKVDQPFTNHKGGTIHFGRDGLLYLALGDGGSANDPGNRAQSGASLLGKVLRIDPNGDDFADDPDNNYHVPASNPFVSESGTRGEIWDFGVRNPFRWSVDANTKALIFADVGQDQYEEVDYEPAGTGGRNYGWRQKEGLHDSGNDGPAHSGPLTDPFLEYNHKVGKSIIGGYIDRNDTLGLNDRYLFADYIKNRLWAIPITLSGGEATHTSMGASDEISVSGGWKGIVSIDPDKDGEPIVTELNAGNVSRLVPVP